MMLTDNTFSWDRKKRERWFHPLHDSCLSPTCALLNCNKIKWLSKIYRKSGFHARQRVSSNFIRWTFNWKKALDQCRECVTLSLTFNLDSWSLRLSLNEVTKFMHKSSERMMRQRGWNENILQASLNFFRIFRAPKTVCGRTGRNTVEINEI